ncbi:MAG: ORF6N domain-containing protein [Bacteroidales bacterium]|nr:ORF6N domain-containing protein [Bacteroidales bacterium]
MKNEQLPTVADLATIRTRIYNVRGKNVMIDKDLAVLYGVETKNSIKR